METNNIQDWRAKVLRIQTFIQQCYADPGMAQVVTFLEAHALNRDLMAATADGDFTQFETLAWNIGLSAQEVDELVGYLPDEGKPEVSASAFASVFVQQVERQYQMRAAEEEQLKRLDDAVWNKLVRQLGDLPREQLVQIVDSAFLTRYKK